MAKIRTRLLPVIRDKHYDEWEEGQDNERRAILDIIDTIETKEEDTIDKKTEWSPSKKQMDSLKDMLKWNIGDFDYKKFMEVKSLYDDLAKMIDYGSIY